MAKKATPQYDANLVGTIKNLLSDGKSPMDIVQEGHVDVDVKTLMAIQRDAGEYGWEKISADVDAIFDDVDDDVDDDEEEEVLAADELKTFGDPEGEETGEPEIAEAQRRVVEETVAAPRRKATKKSPRGKKAANTKDNKLQNRVRRRRRGGNPLDSRRRLLMDMRKVNPDFEYRWFLDRPGRVQEKTQLDDWEVVTDAHIMEGQGGNVTAIAGTNHYNAGSMILMRKPKSWYREDKLEEAQAVAQMESQIIKPGGQSSVNDLGPEALIEQLKNGGVDQSNMYVPKGEQNLIGRVSEEP